jgi:hypothetical protein
MVDKSIAGNLLKNAGNFGFKVNNQVGGWERWHVVDISGILSMIDRENAMAKYYGVFIILKAIMS